MLKFKSANLRVNLNRYKYDTTELINSAIFLLYFYFTR